MQPTHEAFLSAELRGRFARARRVCVLTGAGVSAESGVPTFRGGGDAAVWKDLPVHVISSAEMVERDLQSVWEWFDFRREALGVVSPNQAHFALARWQDRFDEFALVTQNIDGLHQAAGSRDVIELHGNIWRARCKACGAIQPLSHLKQSRTPRCAECDGEMRPDVVLFGEIVPREAFELAILKAGTCDLCFIVGTSAVVYPAAALPEVAKSAGAYVVEINPEPTPLSPLCDEVITGKAGEILPLFDAP